MLASDSLANAAQRLSVARNKDLPRVQPFGQPLRLILLKKNNYSPLSIEISDSKSHALATTLVPGQAPSPSTRAGLTTIKAKSDRNGAAWLQATTLPGAYGTGVPSRLIKPASWINGKPIRAVGSSLVMDSTIVAPRLSDLKLPAQLYGLSAAR